MRITMLLAGLVLLALGGAAVAASRAPTAGWSRALQRGVKAGGAFAGVPDVASGLNGAPGFAALGLGFALTVFAVWPRRERKVNVAQRQASDAELTAVQAPEIDKKAQRRTAKQAEALAKKGDAVAAAEMLLEAGLADRAADLFVQAEQFVRAAEVRHDQNRFIDSAELYQRAGKWDTAGQILSTQSEWAKAAECFLKAKRMSVAAEMFEKAGEFRRAGDCFVEAGFQRHAAQAFVKAQAWPKAAACLESVIVEEFSRTGAGQDPKKQKELRTLVLQAAKLHEQAGSLEKAQAVLERGSCFGAAAEIALRCQRFAQAADLFQRAGDPLKAAQALRQLGEDAEAARILGEYHRDRGEEEEAATAFEQAGEYLSAGDLYRKLERHAEAAACYERYGDAALAADMFRLAGETALAAAAYERANRYADAAECWALVGDRAREAELLAKAGHLLRAGEILHEMGRTDDAIKLLQQVDAGSIDFAAASSLLGRIFRARGQHSLAVKKLRQAIGDAELSRENLGAYVTLAEAHEEAAEWAPAVDIYEKILAFDYHYGDAKARLESAKQKAAAEKAEPALGSTSPSRPAGTPATQPGRYEIEGELGRGGMGIVYKARDTVLDRIVAFKVLPDALKENPQALKNFLREAKSAAQLNHPGIVTVYDAGEQDGRYYIAMEYVDGTTLKEIVRRRGAIAPSGVGHVLVQMCEALAYAHDKKIVHRDIKTANTMWTRDRKAKIMDFGLAKVVEEVRNHTTLVSGTPYYMSPEQTLGRNVDHRTDLYSLGVTLFELATGSLPFREGNVPYHHVHTPPPDPRSVNENLPPVLAEIILRCLQKDPEQRYASAREIVAELRAAAGQGGLKLKPA
jgi:tetratricopeptide (TPR) repeat protein